VTIISIMGNMQHDLSALCNGIFEINEKIRFVGIIDLMGKLIVGDMKKGLLSLERMMAQLGFISDRP
jgi:hypothetical protein